MSKNTQRFRWSLSVAAALAVSSLGLNTARADFAYGYSTQSISGLQVAANTGTLTGVAGSSVVSSGDSATVTSNPVGTVAMLGTNDALQSFIGNGAAPAQNTFTPLGLANANYAHGDTVVSSQDIFGAGGFAAQSVAEAYGVYPPTPVQARADGSWNFSENFTVSTTTTLGFTYNFSNSLVGTVLGTPGNVSANGSYKVDITITDLTAGGPPVYSSSPSELQHSLSAPPNYSDSNSSASGPHHFDSTASFLANHTYKLQISGDTATDIRVVPEPSSIALTMMGLFATAGFLRNRKRVGTSA